MQSQRQQKELEKEGVRKLDFGDHSKEAEKKRVEAENPGRRTAHQLETEFRPAPRNPGEGGTSKRERD